MTDAALSLLRKCALYGVPMRCDDPRIRAAEELIIEGWARWDWTMRGGYAGLRATVRGPVADETMGAKS